ncbi:hypothetical protein [Oscillatoria sp. FACHB-1407]|nr:hypothetical protein [Oscillatoria sp. FACHB-1407]
MDVIISDCGFLAVCGVSLHWRGTLRQRFRRIIQLETDFND